MTIRANLPTEHEGRTGPTTATVVEIDAGRRAAARTSPSPRAAAPVLDDATFHGALNMARKAWDEGSPGEALIHLGFLTRWINGDAA